MDKFGKSQPVRRREDIRFLTGDGGYIDDVAPEGALFAFVFRSNVAHAEISGLDLSEARAADGVALVWSSDDLKAEGLDINIPATVVSNRDGSKGAAPRRPVLAEGRVRFVGEPVAFIVAETMDQARDAAELIEIDFDELEAHVTPVPGGPQIHPEAPDNIAFDWHKGDADVVEAAFASAHRSIAVEVPDNRVIANSLEPRGAFAEWNGTRLHLSFNGQGVWDAKAVIASALGLEPENVRVTNPDVGGGFGMKAMNYPEYFLVAAAARNLGRPVRWMSDRGEAMLSDNAGRDLTSLAEFAFDSENRITAYRVTTTCNLGAYNSQFAQPIQTDLFAKVLMGCYNVQSAYLAVKGVYTNTTQVDAYRGAGRPEAIFVLERALDHAARELGVDPWELRRKNFIPPAAMPFTSATGETYDTGDFFRVLAAAEETSDRAGFAARRKDAESRGNFLGHGLCYYIESILGDPSETARVVFEEDGSVSLFVGTQSNGQGHETVFAQFLSDQTGIPAAMINVIQGDSDLIPTGGGTGGSRSATAQNTASLAVTATLIKGFAEFLAGELGGEVTFDDVTFPIGRLEPDANDA